MYVAVYVEVYVAVYMTVYKGILLFKYKEIIVNHKAISELIERAKKDPKFFHSLVFEPEKVLGSLDGLDRQSRGSIVSSNVEALFANILGLEGCGNTCSTSCDNTCGQSCGYTTNIVEAARIKGGVYFSHFKDALEGCGNTCSSSCDNTCGQSCGYTTNLTLEREKMTRAAGAGMWEGGSALEGCGNTCSSSCDNTCGQSCGYTTSLQGKFGGNVR